MKGPAYQTAQNDKEIFETPLREPKKKVGGNSETLNQDRPEEYAGLEIVNAPSINIEQEAFKAKQAMHPSLSEAKVSRLSFNNMPVGTFINEVFGTQLGLNFVVEPGVKSTPDLVTMRISTPLSQTSFYGPCNRNPENIWCNQLGKK